MLNKDLFYWQDDVMQIYVAHRESTSL